MSTQAQAYETVITRLEEENERLRLEVRDLRDREARRREHRKWLSWFKQRSQ